MIFISLVFASWDISVRANILLQRPFDNMEYIRLLEQTSYIHDICMYENFMIFVYDIATLIFFMQYLFLYWVRIFLLQTYVVAINCYPYILPHLALPCTYMGDLYLMGSMNHDTLINRMGTIDKCRCLWSIYILQMVVAWLSCQYC